MMACRREREVCLGSFRFSMMISDWELMMRIASVWVRRPLSMNSAKGSPWNSGVVSMVLFVVGGIIW